MDDAETVAKFVLEAAFPGSSMMFRFDQPCMEYDFDLHYPNGGVAAVEVTSSRNQNETQTNAKIFKEKKGGEFVPAVKCKRQWHIFPSPDARIDKIRKNADCYLAQLEAEGIETFNSDSIQDSPACVQKISFDLNLTEGVSKKQRAEICIKPVVGSGAADANTAIRAGEKEIESNRKKLGMARTTERHLVVYIDRNNSRPHAALTYLEPPSDLPRLPDEITDIWLVSEHSAAGRFVFWHGSKNAIWRKDFLQT